MIQTDGQVTEHKSDDFNGYITVKDATAVTVLSRTNKYEEDYEHSLAETVLELSLIHIYTDSSWRWFQSALEEAKAVLADSDATQAMVDLSLIHI